MCGRSPSFSSTVLTVDPRIVVSCTHTTGTLTCATLLLQAGVLIKVVQERLGHKRIEMTLNIYAHALPSMQQDAAAKLAALLHS
jgi:integrase